MHYLSEILKNFVNLANAMSIYILFGLLFAGFLKEILPSDFISKHLGKSSFWSVIKATLLGVPMPVCSCSVIPLAKSLQKEGASRGAVQSFLISSPITGVDSIFATYSFFGLFFTFYRVVTSTFIAIFTGLLQNIFDKKELKPKFSKATFSMTKPSIKDESCGGSCCTTNHKEKVFRIKRVFIYAFDILFPDIALSLFIGLVVGALFTTFLPKELLSSMSENLFITYILILFISMPLYVCATSSLPIGASLLLSGLPVGAVFVFLSAGPATNSVTMAVVKEMFGKRAFLIYLFSIAFWSLIFGYVMDSFFSNMKVLENLTQHEGAGVVNYIATFIMIGLMIFYIVKRRK